MPGVRRLTLLLWYVWFVGGGIYYGVILVQPDIIGAEHSGERCKFPDMQHPFHPFHPFRHLIGPTYASNLPLREVMSGSLLLRDCGL